MPETFEAWVHLLSPLIMAVVGLAGGYAILRPKARAEVSAADEKHRNEERLKLGSDVTEAGIAVRQLLARQQIHQTDENEGLFKEAARAVRRVIPLMDEIEHRARAKAIASGLETMAGSIDTLVTLFLSMDLNWSQRAVSGVVADSVEGLGYAIIERTPTKEWFDKSEGCVATFEAFRLAAVIYRNHQFKELIDSITPGTQAPGEGRELALVLLSMGTLKDDSLPSGNRGVDSLKLLPGEFLDAYAPATDSLRRLAAASSATMPEPVRAQSSEDSIQGEDYSEDPL